MGSVRSNAVPRMLRWAREKAGYALDDVETLLKLEPGKLKAWESGDGSPSFAMLKRLGKRYKRPLMVFYLPHPPIGFNVVRDFRVLPNGRRNQFSPLLLYSIRSLQEKQQWAEDYLSELRLPRNRIVGLISRNDSPATAAARLRKRLSVSLDEQLSWGDAGVAYARWRTACEAVGVFAFQSQGVPVEEMRGLALPHRLAPAVVVNSQDPFTARVFTLIHELVHVSLGSTGVTGAGSRIFAPTTTSALERFCNSVATELLVPEAPFLKLVPSDWKSDADTAIRDLAKRFSVSRPVILFRLLETGLADMQFVREKFVLFNVRKPKKKARSGAVPRVTLSLARNGEAFTRLVVSAFRDGAIHGGEVASLIDLKLQHLPKLEQRLFENRLPAMEGDGP